MKVIIKASDVAAAIGQNKYKSKSELLTEIWTKYRPETCRQKTTKDQAVSLITKSEALSQVYNQVKELKTSNVDLTHDLFKQAKTTVEKTGLTGEEQSLVLKQIRSKLNTTYGTNTEDQTADRTGLDLKRDPNFYSLDIVTLDDTKYVVMGRIDRLEGDVLVEIKNRTNSLFKRVVPYEMIQVQTYLEMLNLEKAKLIEQYKDKSWTSVIERDRDMWSDIILPDLVAFCHLVHSKISSDAQQ